MDVVNRMDDIANGYSSSDKSLVRTTLEFLVKNLTGLENKWFIRMILKDMKLGKDYFKKSHYHIILTFLIKPYAVFEVVRFWVFKILWQYGVNVLLLFLKPEYFMLVR